MLFQKLSAPLRQLPEVADFLLIPIPAPQTCSLLLQGKSPKSPGRGRFKHGFAAPSPTRGRERGAPRRGCSRTSATQGTKRMATKARGVQRRTPDPRTGLRSCSCPQDVSWGAAGAAVPRECRDIWPSTAAPRWSCPGVAAVCSDAIKIRITGWACFYFKWYFIMLILSSRRKRRG